MYHSQARKLAIASGAGLNEVPTKVASTEAYQILILLFGIEM